jgi:hypothetical protein
MTTPALRLAAKTDTGAADDCWPWTGARDKDGYGSFWFDGRQQRASRVAWQLANDRPIPDGLVVRHTCDNPPCVNPAHLLLGTSHDNDLDRVERGRSATGERNGARLYPERLVRGPDNVQYQPEGCRNGHNADRRYVSSSGERRCLDCLAARRRRYLARRREQVMA